MLDVSKPVMTRSGKRVRILCTDAKGEKPIVGLITIRTEHPEKKGVMIEFECPFAWLRDGLSFERVRVFPIGHKMRLDDLVNVG